MSNEPMGYTELGSMKFHKEPPKKRKDVNKDLIVKWAFITAIVAVIVLIVFGIVKFIGSGGYESAIKEYMEFVGDSVNGEVNESKLLKQYPKFMTETIEELRDINKDWVEEFYAGEVWEDVKNEFKKGIFTVTYEVIDKERISAEEIVEYQNKISEFVGEDEKVKVQKGYLFNVKIKIKLKNKMKSLIEKETGEEMDDNIFDENIDIVALKCNGKIGVWKINDSYIWDMLDIRDMLDIWY